MSARTVWELVNALEADLHQMSCHIQTLLMLIDHPDIEPSIRDAIDGVLFGMMPCMQSMRAQLYPPRAGDRPIQPFDAR